MITYIKDGDRWSAMSIKLKSLTNHIVIYFDHNNNHITYKDEFKDIKPTKALITLLRVMNLSHIFEGE